MKYSKLAILLAGTAVMSGCAFQKPLHSVAINQNKLVADTANEIALLNIVRAKKRLPLHFTSMRILRGNLSLSTTASVNSGINQQTITDTLTGVSADSLSQTQRVLNNGPETFTPSIGATVTSNPNFELSVFDNREFQRGILQPIAPSLYGYFLNQGYPESYIAELFIERIDLNEVEIKYEHQGEGKFNLNIVDNGDLTTIENNPQNSEEHNSFLKFIKNHNIRVATIERENIPIVGLSELIENSRISDLSILDGENFSIAENDDGKQNIERVRSDVTGFTFEENDDKQSDKKNNPIYKCFSINKTINLSEYNNNELNKNGNNNLKVDEFKELERKGGIGTREVKSFSNTKTSSDKISNSSENICEYNGSFYSTSTVTLRSPESVIYFLGEYARLSGKRLDEIKNDYKRNVIKVYSDDKETDEFLKLDADTTPSISTTLDGINYAVSTQAENPDETSDRSTQTVSLVQQLINLHKSSDDLPAASSVVVSQ